jgi:ferredoxin--NADP+ reductase
LVRTDRKASDHLLIASMKDSRYARIELVDRTDFSDDLALFRFRADESVDFTPGQYATLGVHPDGMKRPLLRAYSIASAPHEETLDFFIELVHEGQLTPQLWTLSLGDRIWMRRKIVGRFTLDETCTQHIMAATVTGVAPYVSFLRAQAHALHEGRRDAPHEMLILHGASHSWEFGTYLDELTAAASRHDWLTYVPTVSRPWDETDWQGEVGRVEDVLRKHADAAGFTGPNVAAYTCGHPQMIDKAQGILRRGQLDEEHVHEEKYWVEKRSPVA